MWKKLLIGLVALGFAWSVPQVRARIVTALAPATSLLGPLGHRMQEPMRRYQAETDIKFLVEQLQMEKNEGRPLPSNVRAFNEWMGRRQGAGDKGRDPWGNLYWMDRTTQGVEVGSNGPDGTRRTEDDLARRAEL